MSYIYTTWASLIAQSVKYLSAMMDTQVQFLGWEDPLEKEMATHSSILAWRIPWTEEPGRLQSMGLQRVRRDSTVLEKEKVASVSGISACFGFSTNRLISSIHVLLSSFSLSPLQGIYLQSKDLFFTLRL